MAPKKVTTKRGKPAAQNHNAAGDAINEQSDAVTLNKIDAANMNETYDASTTDSTKGKRRSISPPKDNGDNVKTDVAVDIAVTLESFLDCSEDIKLRIAAAIRPILREKHRFQHERDFYKSIAEKSENDKAEREKTILILRVRSRIDELEKRFLKPYMLQYIRYQKWTTILNGDLRNLRSVGELMRFRSMITVAHDEFIPTICNLYGEFSDLAAHNITHPIPYDEASITQMLTNFGMIPDNTKINTVITLLTPIP